ILARHDRARMRTVRNATRMQGDGPALDSAARSEIATHVKQNFVRFDVVVHPRNFYRLRVRIEQARRKCAHNVTANLKRLMDRRRLMHRAGDRLEILRVKSKRIKITIPADGIEWIMRERDARETRTVLH